MSVLSHCVSLIYYTVSLARLRNTVKTRIKRTYVFQFQANAVLIYWVLSENQPQAVLNMYINSVSK